MQEALTSILLADEPLCELLGDAREGQPIHWNDRPDFSGLPGITLQVISETRSYHQVGRDTAISKRVQFDFWASDYLSAETVNRRVSVLLESIKQDTSHGTEIIKCYLDSVREFRAVDTSGGDKVFRISADYIIWHR